MDSTSRGLYRDIKVADREHSGVLAGRHIPHHIHHDLAGGPGQEVLFDGLHRHIVLGEEGADECGVRWVVAEHGDVTRREGGVLEELLNPRQQMVGEEHLLLAGSWVPFLQIDDLDGRPTWGVFTCWENLLRF